MEMIILGGLVLSLTEVAKRTVGIKSRYIPATAVLVTAILVSCYLVVNSLPLTWEIIQSSLIVALTSVGLFSGVKNTIK